MSETRENAGDPVDERRQGLNLFLVGFLVLFFELACIRWFAANVVFLQFFTNVVLIACFLGMSCGCLAARRRWNWLAATPLLALATFAAAHALLVVYSYWGGRADVRRARPSAGPRLRRLSKPGPRLFLEHRRKPRRHPGVFRAFPRAGAAGGVVPDRLRRHRLSPLSGQSPVAAASAGARGIGDLRLDSHQSVRPARNSLVALLRRRFEENDRPHHRQHDWPPIDGAFPGRRLVVLADPLAGAAKRRPAVSRRIDHRRRMQWRSIR